jgi:uncharacterized membrane protein YeaQ/YmgE (transglycosylase-associated protein family)
MKLLAVFLSMILLPYGAAANPSIEIINPSLHQKTLSLLGDRAAVIQNARILAFGFESDIADSAHKRLVIFTLDSLNEPQRTAVEIDSGFYHALYKIPDSTAMKSVDIAGPLKIPKKPPTIALRQDGRGYFMLNTTLKSLWVYPINVSMGFPEIDGQIIAGLSVLTLGASLYGSYLFTKNRELGYGRVEFLNYGADLGGLIYPNLLGLFFENLSHVSTKKASVWIGMIGFPAGIYLGSRARFAGNDEYGNASIMTTMSRWGFLYGFLIPLYFELKEDDFLALSSGLTMGLIPAGFYIGKKLVGDRNFSSGRSILIMASGIMGAATGALIPTLWESKEQKLYATIIGQILGTYFGFNYLQDRSYGFSQGLFISASAIAGGAIAEAPLLLAQVNPDISHRAYTVLGVAGAWGGLLIGEFLSRTLFEKNPRDKRAGVAVSLPGILEVPLLLVSRKSDSPGTPASLDKREPIAKARVMDISF